MRLHVIGFPHSELTREWEFCAFTTRTRVFATMMHERGWDVITYAPGPSESTAPHVSVADRWDQKRWWPDYGPGLQVVFNDFDPNGPQWSEFNARVAAAIRDRFTPGDIVCMTMGFSNKPVIDALGDLEGLFAVETGVGYKGVWAPYRVYESYAWKHYLTAREPIDDERFFDAVIPRSWETAEFPVGKGDGGYALFCGRLTRRKGPHIAADAAKRMGIKLLYAGQGVAHSEPGKIVTTEGMVIEGDVEYVGIVGPKERAELMGRAAFMFAPTIYLEPLGGVVCEAMLTGTPVVTTDIGAFTENVQQGVTGFRCKTLAEFVSAGNKAASLDRSKIAAYATSRFSTEVVGAQFDEYFARLSTIRGEGWYT